MTSTEDPRSDAAAEDREAETDAPSSFPRSKLDGLLGPLARFFGLDVYARSLLSRRALIEMKLLALLLLIIFFFELGAWTLLFNSILYSDLLQFGPRTALAVIPALLFAGAVLIYERQFVTTDLLGASGRQVIGPVAVRLMVIVAAALITAQPVELLIFRSQIVQRVHEEGVRREAVVRRAELLDAQEREQQARTDLREIATGDLKLRSDRRLEESEQAWREERDRGPEIARRLDRAQGSVNYWDGELKRRRASLAQARAREGLDAPSAEELTTLESSISEARRNLGAWATRRDQARIDRDVNAGRLEDLSASLDRARSEVSEQREEFLAEGRRVEGLGRAAQDRLQRWIGHLASIEPAAGVIVDETPPEASADAEAYAYRVPSYDFFEQLRVLDDLRRGFPPQWPGVETAEADRLAQVYGLAAVRPCPGQEVGPFAPAASADPGCRPEDWLRHEARRAQFNRSYWVVFVIAIVIPLLVIATKWLMTPELKAYYSSAYQAAYGQPEAVVLKDCRAQVRAEQETVFG